MSIRSLFATVFFCLPFGVLMSHSALGQLGDEATPQQLSVPNIHHWERTHNESRLPFSFIATESRGLEVVSLHEDQPKMRLSRTDATGRRFIGSVEAGDRIVSANGQTLTGVDEFFKVLNRTTGKFPIDVADARSGMILKWQVEPIEVEIPAFPAPANADGTGLLHIVHVIDSKDDSIGDLIELNSGSIRSLFTSHVAENRRGEFKLLAGDDCSASNIISTINSLPIRSQDTLLVFVQCHGAYDTNFEVPEPSAGHFFDLQNNDLRRYHVLNAMKARGARLTLLISDCCNRKSIRTRTRSVYETWVAPVDGWSGFEELMFCYKGTLDLTSASRGQSSWCTSDMGGWFVSAFFSQMQEASTKKDRKWSEVWNLVKKETREIFDDKKAKYKNNAKLQAQLTMVPQEFIWSIERNDDPNEPKGQRIIPLITSRRIEVED